jgi:hypothetical protein
MSIRQKYRLLFGPPGCCSVSRRVVRDASGTTHVLLEDGDLGLVRGYNPVIQGISWTGSSLDTYLYSGTIRATNFVVEPCTV